MDDGIGKTIKLFLLWLGLFLALPIIGAIVGRFFTSPANYEILKWSQLLGYVLMIIIFFGKRYVELSFGHIERRMVWPAVGMSVLRRIRASSTACFRNCRNTQCLHFCPNRRRDLFSRHYS